MNSLLTRVISAFVGLIFFGALIYFFGDNGLRALTYMAVVIGVQEITRILFVPEDSWLMKSFFALSVWSIFLFTLHLPQHSTLAFAVVSIVFCSATLVFLKRFSDLSELSGFQAKSVLGFFYVGLLPALTSLLINLPDGRFWFFSTLLIVFAGDTFAYAAGILWGDRKILPLISPKKTVVGSYGGLVGSVAAACVCGTLWFPQYPLWSLALLGLLTGVFGQLGDLFESMLKRVANVKDSGKIMPGHGGLLDRIDGVLFGAPFVLAGAHLLARYLSSQT